MRLYVGIDGGQSSTTALIGDETGRVLGVGRSGPSNHAGAGQGRRKFVAAITGAMEDSLTQAAASAGVSEPAVFEAACLGLSGGPDDKQTLARELIRAERYLITHDAHIALAGATGGAPGIVAIAGTGSMVFGRNAAGVTARAGGWGYVFGDEGGAFDLVRQALRAILRNEEGWGPPTALRAALLEALPQTTGARDAHRLMHLLYTDEYPRDRVAGWAKLIDQAARAGDPVAGDILGSAAQALATMTAAVRRQLFVPSEQVDVRYSGGVFRSDPLRERFQMLVELEEGTRVSAPLHGAAEGALIEAYRMSGIEVPLRRFTEAMR
jgi:N-acetylglucosamine kinase-like BadF-type ATPase